MLAAPSPGATRPIGPSRPRRPAVPGKQTAARAARAGGALLTAARPRQWVKNLLVLLAPAAAGVLGQAGQLGRTTAAVGVFVAASGGTYLLNDVRDVRADRQHPTKRFRPVASGAIGQATAVVAGAVLLAGAMAGAAMLGLASMGVVGGYVALTVAYTLYLKRVPFVELACISLAFVLRALGGAAATGVPVSPWFLLVTSAGALLIASGKRTAEQGLLGTGGAAHRRSLSAYPPWLLGAIRIGSGVAAVGGYVLWALWRQAHADGHGRDVDDLTIGLSAIPFALAVAALERLLAAGRGGAPEELALKSRALQGLGLACVVLVAIGIYR